MILKLCISNTRAPFDRVMYIFRNMCVCVLPVVLQGEVVIQNTNSRFFALFRPLCPAFSFAEVDTYAITYWNSHRYHYQRTTSIQISLNTFRLNYTMRPIPDRLTP